MSAKVIPLRSLPRLFIPGANFSEGKVQLPKSEIDKFRRVLRLKVGDQIAILPNDGTVVRCAWNDAVAELIALAAQRITVIMCAEAVFWQCHRALVADALLVRGVDVQHIMGAGKLTSATMTSFAKPDGTQITYPSV